MAISWVKKISEIIEIASGLHWVVYKHGLAAQMYQIIHYNKKCQLLSLQLSNMRTLLAMCEKGEW